MTDLTYYIPIESETVKRIYKWHKERGDKKARPSRRLGASIAGSECDRFLWYAFRWCCKPEFEGRMYRLFDTGHKEEERFVEELRGIGVEVHDRDPETGKQIEATAVGGHFVDRLDGVALGIPEAPKTWHVLEFKTHNAKSFKQLDSSKGLANTHPKHYAQCMVGMSLMGMTRALYLAKNKDTDELYAERIRCDKAEADLIISRAECIIKATEPPQRITKRSDDFRCKFCDAYGLCWGMREDIAVPLPWGKNCRSCCHATPIVEGSNAGDWRCEKAKDVIPASIIPKGCDDHLILPALISFADPVDAGDDWIEFQSHNPQAIWRHGKGNEAWGTDELINGRGPLDGVKEVETLWTGKKDGVSAALKDLGYSDMVITAPTAEYADKSFTRRFLYWDWGNVSIEVVIEACGAAKITRHIGEDV